MEVKSIGKYSRRGPRKVRLITSELKGLDISMARDFLKHSEKESAGVVLKVLNSAIANAIHNEKLDETKLIVKNCFTNSGPILKRYRFGGRGRIKPIKKRTSHIVVSVGEREDS